MHKILIDGEWFTDENGRKVILRGSNIACKMPDAINPKTSFTNIPFPLEEAGEHFERLSYWGFNCLRYTVTWESIEHEGPGIYDYTFLNYLVKILEEASKHNLFVFIDFHQDVWSRFTGGSGAPAWTLELAGFDLEGLEATGATVVSKNSELAHLLWPTNAFKLAAATMFTLFFAGNVFTPKTQIGGENIQTFLQRHYLNALKEIAKHVKHLPNIIGFDIMNEPLRGYIEWKDLRSYEGFFSLGFTPTPFQSMVLGMGNPQLIEYWDKTTFVLKKTGLRTVNPKGKKAWKKDCIWREHGVWDYKSNIPHLLQPDYFFYHQNRRVRFTDDFYRPFVRYVSEGLRQIQQDTIIFVQNELYHKPPVWGVQDPTNIVFSTHWYDAYVLVLKRFCPFLGADGSNKSFLIAFPPKIRKFFAKQIERLKGFAGERIGKVPTMITEFGIAFDIDKKKAYRTGNFSKQEKALNRSFQAIEDNVLSCTIWNYFPNHSQEKGDHWNCEDLSIYSADQDGDKEDRYYGARAKKALIRPYPIYTPGTPRSMHFDMKSSCFFFSYTSDEKADGVLEVFLPCLHFQNIKVEVSDGTYEVDLEKQRLFYRHSNTRKEHSICIKQVNP